MAFLVSKFWTLRKNSVILSAFYPGLQSGHPLKGVRQDLFLEVYMYAGFHRHYHSFILSRGVTRSGGYGEHWVFCGKKLQDCLENWMIWCTLRKILRFGALLEKKLFCAILQKLHDLCTHTVENPIIWCIRRKFYGLVHSSKFYGLVHY